MRIAVIGGGMAGLSAAHALLTGGAEPVVFEESRAAGGKVGSCSEGGYLTEDGPHFLARPLDALLEALGLRGEVVLPEGPRTRFVHLGGRVFPAPGLSLLARAGALRRRRAPCSGMGAGRDQRSGPCAREWERSRRPSAARWGRGCGWERGCSTSRPGAA